MYKRLVSDTFVYGLGAILVKAIAFFTLPIYTRLFTPVEYGVIEMFATVGGILSILMTMGLDSAQSYYFMEAKNSKTRKIEEITTTVLGMRIVLGITVVGVISILSPFILDFAFDTNVPKYFLFMVATSIFFANLISQSLEIYRLIYKSWHYIALSFLQTVSNIGLILYFSLYQDMGLSGYFLGMVVSSFIVMFISWWATRNYRYFKFLNLSLCSELVKFGLPLVPAGLSIWLMQAGDRWFVMKILGGHDLGVYAVGAKVAMIATIAVSVFRQAWWPIAMDMIQKADGAEFVRQISLIYIALGCLGAVVMALIAPYLVSFLADEVYYESYKLVGILSLSGVLYGFYLIGSLGIFKSKKTYWSVYTNSAAALLNIILNYFLIKRFGMLGAAYATVISMFFANIMGMFISNRYLPIRWNWLAMGSCLFLALVVVLYLGT